MMQALLDQIPEVVVVGSAEMFFLGAAFALGSPRLAKRVIRRRYRGSDNEDDDESVSNSGQ